MDDWVKRALTRKMHRKGARRAFEDFEITPNEELVYGVKFAIGMTVCLSAIEIAQMAFLHSWNSEVFAAMTGLTGFVTGILIGHHA
jgi:hypothetical protein